MRDWRCCARKAPPTADGVDDEHHKGVRKDEAQVKSRVAVDGEVWQTRDRIE